MKSQPFTSEYADEQVVAIEGEPLTNAELNAFVEALETQDRVEAAHEHLVLGVVGDFYFAKYFWLGLDGFGDYTNALAQRSLRQIGAILVRSAVMALGAATDSNQATARTKSIRHTLGALERALTLSPAEHARESRAIKRITASVNPDLVASLKYVRHLRNKWAAHASLDLVFDSWAGADEHVSFALLEDALVRLVNAHKDMADLVAESPFLAAEVSVLANLEEGIEFSIAWTGIYQIAEVARFDAQRRAEAVFDQLGAPPGYGTPSDTDWGPGSVHSQLREEIDTVAAEFLRDQ